MSVFFPDVPVDIAISMFAESGLITGLNTAIFIEVERCQWQSLYDDVQTLYVMNKNLNAGLGVNSVDANAAPRTQECSDFIDSVRDGKAHSNFEVDQMHSKIVKNSGQNLTVKEWVQTAENFDCLHITDKLKQQNPFTDEFLLMDVPGSGYWIPGNYRYEGWPGDGSVVFSPSGNGIVFIQFIDIHDAELHEIAKAVGGKVISYVIGG